MTPEAVVDEGLLYEETALKPEPEPEPAPVPEPPAPAHTSDRGRLKAPEPPEHEADKTSPERIYIYELESEQRPPMAGDEAFSDVVLDRGNPYGLDLDLKPAPASGDIDSRRDEPLIFEVTPEASLGGSGGSKPDNTSRQPGLITGPAEERAPVKGRRRKKPVEETPME